VNYPLGSAARTCLARQVPIPLVLWVGLLLGLAFARAASGVLSQTGNAGLSSPAFPIVSVFAVLVYAPVVGFSVSLAPDWACAYLIDTQRLPAAFETFSVVFAASSAVLGFIWGAEPSARRHWNVIGRRMILVGIALVTTMAPLIPRFKVQATFTQYRGDFGIRPIAGTELGYALLWMLVLLGLAGTWTIFSLYRMGRQPIRD